MSDSDVETIETMDPRLSDTDAEALFAGRSVAEVPQELSEILSHMREQATSGPAVPLSAAVSEFIVESVASVTPIRTTASTPTSRRRRSRAKKAAAAFAIVPAKMLVGATMAAAAAVGGAQALGVVDVPFLPGPDPQVVSTVPVETVPETSVASSVPAATTVTSAPGSMDTARTAISAPGSTERVGSDAAMSAPPTVAPVASSNTDSTHGAVEGDPACGFGQEAPGQRGGESNADVPVPRPDNGANTTTPSIEPCERGDSERAPASVPSSSPSSAAVDRDRGTGAPSVSGDDKASSRDVSSAPPTKNEQDDSVSSGDGSPSANPSDTLPEDSAAPDDSDRDTEKATESPKNSERGRTPAGD